jgi:hypothetical protein
MIQNIDFKDTTTLQKPAKNPPRKKPRLNKKYAEIQFNLSVPAQAEGALWIAVITQAMQDALTKSRKSEDLYYKQEAVAWLTGNSASFIFVCQLAGLHHDDIRRKAKRVIAAPKNWRMEAGKGKRYEERKAYRTRLKNQQKGEK